MLFASFTLPAAWAASAVAAAGRRLSRYAAARAAARVLSLMDDRALADIGLVRSDADFAPRYERSSR